MLFLFKGSANIFFDKLKYWIYLFLQIEIFYMFLFDKLKFFTYLINYGFALLLFDKF